MSRARHNGAQQGAALVIGLVLLVVLTLLAVSSMNSASLEFVMAGNEQYRSNAFQAAETGIEQALFQGTFSTNDTLPKPIGPGVNGADAWSAVVTMPIGNSPLNAPDNYDQNKFSTYHFEITSTGTSTRGANAINTQGVMVLSPSSPDVKADPNGNTTQLN